MVFLERGAALNTANRHGTTPLMKLVKSLAERRDRSTAAVAKILIQHGADVNKLDKAEKPAAWFARSKRLMETALVLEAGMTGPVDAPSVVDDQAAATSLTDDSDDEALRKNTDGLDHGMLEQDEDYESAMEEAMVGDGAKQAHGDDVIPDAKEERDRSDSDDDE